MDKTNPSWSDKLEKLLIQFSSGKDAKVMQSMYMRDNVFCTVSQETENTLHARAGINSIFSDVHTKGRRETSGIILQIADEDAEEAIKEGGIYLNSGTWYDDKTDEEVGYQNIVFLGWEQIDTPLEYSFREFGSESDKWLKTNRAHFKD